MNLDELQIKISIELDDLNKQLKSITKDIDNTLGPKATKKLMADNNKVIKSGFRDMNKTAKTSVKQMHKDITKEFESMSKDISKSLNKAFELDMRKFNSNLTKSMNDAKSTVRSACNDIRRELNAALNVKANIKVNASASVSSNNNVTSSSSTAAAIMQSSQYTGAMITKAVNEMIKVSTANTTRIEASIKHIESALISAFSKLGSNMQSSNDKTRTTGSNKDKTSSDHKLNIKADVETSVRVVEEGLQSEIDKIIKNLDVSDVKTSLVLDENIKEEVDKAINNVKAEDITLKADLETNMNLNANELQNDVNKAIREVSTRDIETSINVDKSHLQDDVSSAIKEIDVPELNTTIELKGNLQNDVNKAIREVDIRDFNATVKLSENVHSELQGEVNSLVSKVEVPTLVSSLEVDGRTLQSSVNEIVSKIAIPDLAIPLRLDDYLFQFGVKDISRLMVPDLVVSFKLDRDSISTLQTNVNEAIRQIKIPPIVVPVEIAQSKTKEANKKNKTKKPGPINKNKNEANKSSIDIPVNIADADKIQAIRDKLLACGREAKDLRNEFLETFASGSGEKLIKDLEEIQEKLNKLNSDNKGVLAKGFSDIDDKVLNNIAQSVHDTINEIGQVFEGTIDDLKRKADDAFNELSITLDSSDAEKKLKEMQMKFISANTKGKTDKNTASKPSDLKQVDNNFDFTNLESAKKQVTKDTETVSDVVGKTLKEMSSSLGQTANEIKQQQIGKKNVPKVGQVFTGSLKKKQQSKNNFDFTDPDELAISSDDIFGEMSEVVDKEINEISKKLKDLNMIYTSLFNRTVISDSLKYDLNIANKALEETHNNIKALKAFIDSLSGSTSPDFGDLTDESTPSLMIGDDESFGEFGGKLSNEIDRIRQSLQQLDMLYTSLFSNEYLGTAFEDSSNIANKALEETIKTVEELKVSMQSLNEYAGFQNKFESPEPAGLPILASDALNEPFDAISKDIDDAHKQVTEFNKAISDLFDYLQMPIGAKFSKSIGEVEELKNAISNLLSMNQFGSGLEGLEKQLEFNTEQIEENIRKIFKALQTPFAFPDTSNFKEVATLNGIIKEICGVDPGVDIINQKSLLETTEEFKNFLNFLNQLDTGAFLDFFGSTDEVKKEIEDLEKALIEVKENADSTKIEIQCAEEVLPMLEDVKKHLKQIEEEEIEIYLKLKAEADAKAISDGFKELYTKATMDAVKADNAVKVPVDFELVAEGAKNFEKLFNLPEFKEHAEALRDILSGIDLSDELKTNLDLDGLLDKLKSIQSIDDIDIDLSELKTDLIKLADEIGKIRDTADDEIKIKVIDDEVAKIKELLKLLEQIQSKSNVNIDVNASGPILGSGNFSTRRGVGSGSFSTTPGGSGGGGNRGGGYSFGADSGDFDRGHTNSGPSGWDTGMDFNAHVRSYNMDKLVKQFKEAAKKIKPIMKDLGDKIKNSLKGALSKVANTAKTLWSKITGIFKKGSKDCEKAISPLKGTLRSLIGMFGLYRLGDMFVEGTKQAIQYEASLMTIQRTLGGASQTLIDFANNNAQAFGISKSQVMEFGNIFSVIVSNFEKDGTKIAGTTQKLLESAGIIAGATGYDVNQVLENLRSGILGSSEAVDQLGLSLKVASLEASESFKQIANGAKSWNDLTEAQKQAIIAQEIINQTTAKYGGIVKNTSSMHNAFMAQLSNTKLALGKLGKALYTAILPALTTIMAVLEKVFTYAAQVVTSILSVFGITVDFASNIQPPDDSLGESVGESFDDTKESVDDATEAVEKFKGSLAGFDEINILSDNTSKDAETPEIPEDGGITDIGTPEVSEVESPFDKIGKKFKAFIDEVLEPFKKAWELYGNDLKQEWEDLKESFKHFCDSLGKFLKSVWEHGGKEFVQHMAEIGLACAIAAMEIGGEILDSLARLWDHLDPAKNMNTQGFLNALNEVSVKLRDFILGLGDHFESLMANGGQDVLNAMGDCFMNLGEAAARGLGVAIDALDGFIDHLDPAVNENTKNMLQSLADMFHAVGQTALDFVSLLESCLVNGGQNMINAFGDMMMNMGQATSEVITTIMTSFSELFKYLDPTTNEITKNMMKAWEDAFLAIGESALTFSGLFESTMLNGGQEVLNKLGDAFNSLVGLVGTIVEEIADALTGLYEHLDPKTNTFTQNMLKAWQTAFENISSLCDTLGETLSSIMDNGGQDLLNALGDLAMQISEFFATIVGEAAECMGEFAEHIDPSKNKVTAGALDAFKYFIDSIRNFVEMLGDALGTFMDNGGQEFVNNLGDIIALVGDLAFTIGGDIINAITTFMDSWAGQMLIEGCARALEVISEVLEGLLRILEPLSPIISGVVTAIGGFMIASKVVGFIQGIATVFQTIAGSGGVLALAKAGFTALWGIIAANPIAATVAAIVGIGTVLVALYNKCEWFREAVDKVFARIKEPVEKLMETFSDLLENVTDIFGNIIDIIVGIFEGDGYKVGEAVRNMVLNVIEIFKGLFEFKQNLAEIGWNLILGLIEGIWECIKNIPQLLAGLGEFVVDFFKGLFGIHSPSTVFAELGVNLIEGLIEGIESMISNIGEVFTNIKEAVVGWVQDIVVDATEKWSEIKSNIVDNLGKLYDEATEKWKDIYDSVSEKCKDIYDDTKEKWSNIKKAVSDKYKEIFDDTKDKWTNIKDKTIEITSDLKEKAEEKYTQLKDKLTDTTDKWRQNSEDKWNKIKDKTNELTTSIKDTVEERYTKFKDALTNTMDKWRQNSEDKWKKVKSKTEELTTNLKDTVEEKYGKFRDNLTSTMDNWRSNSEEKWNTIKNKTNELSTKLKDEVEEKYGKFRDNLTSLMENWRSNNEGKWDAVKGNTTSFVNTIKGDVEKKYEKFRDNLTGFMENWRSNNESKWDAVKGKTYELVDKLRGEAEGLYGKLKSNLGTILDNVKTEAGTKWESIKSTTNGIVEKIVSEASNIFGNIKGALTKKIDDAKAALGPKWEELKTNAKNGASKISQGFSDGISNFKKPFLNIYYEMENLIRDIGRALKNADWSFPKIKLPHIKITGKWSFNPPSVPKFGIEWYKRGGIIDGITPLGFANGSLHMGGEAGKEMVVPLENTSFTSKIAQAMGQAVDNAMARNMNSMYGSSYNNNNDSKDIILKVNERELARASINSINKLQRESGRTLLDI